MAKSNKAAEVKTVAIAAADKGKGALIAADSFALIADPDAMDAMNYNLAGEQLSEFDLDRIRVPAAGGTAFQVPGLEGVKNEDEITGIILSVSVRRAYWEDPNPTGAPPDCSSADGFTGVGTPGGDCATCPFNEFGSAVKQDGSEGRGKRCRESRTILMIREQDRLPVAVIAPAGSLKNVKQYLMRLPVPMFLAVTKVTLTPDKNADGVKYSKIELAYTGHLPATAIAGLKKFAATIKNAIIAKAPVAQDFNSHEGDGQIIDSLPADPPGEGGGDPAGEAS